MIVHVTKPAAASLILPISSDTSSHAIVPHYNLAALQLVKLIDLPHGPKFLPQFLIMVQLPHAIGICPSLGRCWFSFIWRQKLANL